MNPRDIPARAHYDRLMTWATGVFSRIGPESLAELQRELAERGKNAAVSSSASDDEKIAAVLCELGFCAVIDNMAGIIEDGVEDVPVTREWKRKADAAIAAMDADTAYMNAKSIFVASGTNADRKATVEAGVARDITRVAYLAAREKEQA